MSIKAENITKLYGEQKVLDNVSFEILTGEIVGFLGPNGAGKSTMMKIITGFIPQTSGSIYVNNIDVLEEGLEIRKHIGYLPENNPLYLEMYVVEYLKYVAGLYTLGKKTEERIKQIITQTGLENESHKKIEELSKGYRQRVGLAQALIHNPDVLILDEPTSGLDPNQIVEIRNLISEIGKEKTVLLSTHIMQEVEAVCSRVIIVNNGKVVANEKTGNLQSKVENKLQSIVVEFTGSIDEKRLKAVKNVIKAVKLKDNFWVIQSTKEQDIRKRIFDFAVKNNYTVLSMQKQEKNLEEIFQELTSKK